MIVTRATKWFLTLPLLPTPTFPKLHSPYTPCRPPSRIHLKEEHDAKREDAEALTASFCGCLRFGTLDGGGGRLTLEPK